MGNRNFILESSINFNTPEEYEEYRDRAYNREKIGHLIEGLREEQERALSEITFNSYFRTSRPFSADAKGRDILCGDKDDRPKTKKITVVDDGEIKQLRVLHIHTRQQKSPKRHKGYL